MYVLLFSKADLITCCLCLGNFDLDVSGNLRPSPTLSGVSRHNRNSSKLAALHQALHGKEVYGCDNIMLILCFEFITLFMMFGSQFIMDSFTCT